MHLSKKQAEIMKGVGVALAATSLIATTSAVIGSKNPNVKKKIKDTVNKVSDFVDTVSSAF